MFTALLTSRLAARALLGLLLGWFSLGAATVEAARVAPLAPNLNPSAGPELRDRFQDAVARGLQQGAAAGSLAGVDVMPGSDVRVRLQASDDLLGCISGPCLQKAAAELKADRVLVAQIDISGKNYNITLRLIDQGGAEVARTTEQCEICTVREADEAVGRAAARLADQVNKPGPTDQARAAQAAAEQKQAQDKATAHKEAPNPAPDPTEVRHLGYRYGWISALVLSGIFVAASVPFLYYGSKDGQTNCDPSVARTNCPTIYQGNLSTGLGLLLGGGLVVGGGAFAVLFYLDRRDQKRASAARVSRLRIDRQGQQWALGGRF